MGKLDIEVIFSEPFERVLKQLAKTYRRVKQDITELVDQLERGETPGDLLQNVAPYIVYKTRVKNSDARRGKSGGYRVIYYLRTSEMVYMVYMYSKSDQSDITDSFLRQILDEIEQAETPDE